MTTDLSEMIWNLDAEQALIGSLMIDNSSISKVLPILKKGDFYRDAHQVMFDAIHALYQRGEPCDPITINDELEGMGKLDEVGGPAAVTEFFMRVPTALHIEHYANIVADKGARRRLVWTAEKIKEAAREDAPLEVIRQKADRWLGQATPLISRTIDHVSAAVEQMAEKQAQLEAGTAQFFLPAALREVDQNFGGYARGELTVFSAPTGEGKTALGLQEALDKARRGYGVAYVSTEVYAHVITERLVAHDGQINYDQVRKGFDPRFTDLPHARRNRDDYKLAMAASWERLQELPLHIMAPVMDIRARRVTRPDLTPFGIRASLKAYAEKHPLDFIVVDYLTNLDLPLGKGSSDRSLIVEAALRTLREMGIELGAGVLVLAQLTREAAREREPRLHHLEQSTGIEKGADNVWLMYTPDKDNDHIRKIVGAKGRNVSKGVADNIHFDGAVQTFTDEYARQLEENYSW